VLAIPGRPEWRGSEDLFDASNDSHRKQMWICRVVLFFRCVFRRQGPPGSSAQSIPCTLALVNRLREFTVHEASESPLSPFLAAVMSFSLSRKFGKQSVR
jgi:hypothetical protein